MSLIQLRTLIKAPIEEVFDLSRNIDFHINSAKQTKEKAIAGRTSGLIGLHETVTWRGKHFGIYLTHQSKITDFEYPNRFTDEMVKGHFRSFKHQHIFKDSETGTEMIDILEYKTPYGFWGYFFDTMMLKRHLTQFLQNRNSFIKSSLENKK
ncbi:SRPBCC family protein [Aquimarina sp. MMG016]|uniref:SRPBCC family protein n=1 Tax=Aquimarina sp. MMG016 TaxID=2822690 RepID=UPI001B3A3C7A|nr:SRPBCC family protein [Aquimarina sp. MMG016]MBQ4821498.1 SRPBCC family protein [Aquimarina sp. MMG016]